MEWISTKDKLPETPRFIIAFKSTQPNVLGLYFDSSKKFMYSKTDHTRYVTHWMPLPSPPEK